MESNQRLYEMVTPCVKDVKCIADSKEDYHALKAAFLVVEDIVLALVLVVALVAIVTGKHFTSFTHGVTISYNL